MKLATLCYIKDKSKTLMIHRNKRANDSHEGKWNGLGGKLHFGETPEECVIREVRGECGLTIKDPSLRGILTFPAFQNDEDWYVYVFVAREFSGRLIDSEEGQLAWIDDDKLPSLNLWKGDPIFLEWIDQGRLFSGKFFYDNGRFIRHEVVFHSWQLPSHAYR